MNATTAYLLARVAGGTALWTFATLAALRRVLDAGLGPLELVLVGTTLEITVLLAEVPTGVFADLFGRKKSVLVGYLLFGVGFWFESLVLSFPALLAAQVVWGIGAAFLSGALEAWIADEVGPDVVAPLYLRGAQADQLGVLAGIALATAAGTVALAFPLRIAGTLELLLVATLWLAMPERGFRPAPPAQRHSLGAFASTLRAGVGAVRLRPGLRSVLVVAGFLGLSSEGLDRLWEFHLLRTIGLPASPELTPAVWIGSLRAASVVLALAATEWFRRGAAARGAAASDVRGSIATLLGLTAGLATAVLGFALAGSFALAALCYFAIAICRRVSDPVLDAWTNDGLAPATRATVFSIRNQCWSAGEIGGGVAFGSIGFALSVRSALLAAGLALGPAVAFLARALRR